jgi:predicted nucleotidyltransferase
MTVAEVLRTHMAPQVRDLCQRYGVRRLEVFGSATTDAFDASRSDVDFLYAFNDTAASNLADRFFGLMEELESLVGRKVDLVAIDAIRNPYLLRAVNEQRQVLYAA